MLNFLLYIVDFFVILFLFSLVWKYIVVLPLSFVFALLKLPDKTGNLIKIAEVYFAISLLGLLTLGAMYEYNNLTAKILVALTGIFFVFFYYGNSIYQKESEARAELDYIVLSNIKYDYYAMYGAIILFIVILFSPIIATTPPVLFCFNFLDWLYNLNFIGGIIRFCLFILGFWMAISWLFNGVLFFVFIISSIIYKFLPKSDKEIET